MWPIFFCGNTLVLDIRYQGYHWSHSNKYKLENTATLEPCAINIKNNELTSIVAHKFSLRKLIFQMWWFPGCLDNWITPMFNSTMEPHLISLSGSTVDLLWLASKSEVLNFLDTIQFDMVYSENLNGFAKTYNTATAITCYLLCSRLNVVNCGCE